MDIENLGKGLLPDSDDHRDFRLADVFSAAPPDPFDWAKGHSVYEKHSPLTPVREDQNGSSSCVSQGTAQYKRVVWYAATGEAKDFSRRRIYSEIHMPGGGAQLRDGVAFLCDPGDCLESTAPSYDNGNPPSEDFMTSLVVTQAMIDEGHRFEDLSYHVIPGGTADIEVFAQAIRDCDGILGGFTGTNAGWCQSAIRPPQPGESTWGHCVYLCAAGLTDVDLPGLPKGSKCVFTPNSWGGRYTITEGRWKGLQAIPEAYFSASASTAVGTVGGIYVFNSWAVLPKASVPMDVQAANFLKQNDNGLVQRNCAAPNDAGNGAIGLSKGGVLLITSADRAGLLALTCIGRAVHGPIAQVTDPALWDALPKADF